MRRRPRATRVEPPAVSQCAWCGETLANQEVFGFGAKATPGADVRRYRGQVIEIELVGAGRRAPTFVVGAGSPAAREGHDLYFMTCSAGCVTALRTALQGEIARGEGSRPGPDAGP